jgi:hypothetical protein
MLALGLSTRGAMAIGILRRKVARMMAGNQVARVAHTTSGLIGFDRLVGQVVRAPRDHGSALFRHQPGSPGARLRRCLACPARCCACAGRIPHPRLFPSLRCFPLTPAKPVLCHAIGVTSRSLWQSPAMLHRDNPHIVQQRCPVCRHLSAGGVALPRKSISEISNGESPKSKRDDDCYRTGRLFPAVKQTTDGYLHVTAHDGFGRDIAGGTAGSLLLSRSIDGPPCDSAPLMASVSL